MECPGCSGQATRNYSQDGKTFTGVYVCESCGGIVGTCYLGESYSIARNSFANTGIDVQDWQYVDLICLGSAGITRRHGWIDPQTREWMQVG